MKKILFTFCAMTPLITQAQNITTCAGNGLGEYSGDLLPATVAAIGFPGGINFNKSGEYYFTEFNNTIRKVSNLGIITTVAGNGTTGFSGDNGNAILATLNGPSNVAIDLTGNVYCSDYYNNRIRKLNTLTGTITTVAGNGTPGFSGEGGPATAASIYGPQGLDFDTDGNLYFCDYQNHRIRTINAATGNITTVAGNGIDAYNGDNIPATSAQVSANYGLHLDILGNIYFADGYRVRKIDKLTGIITTIAGTGAGGDGTDGALATNSKIGQIYDAVVDVSGDVYISDVDYNKIRKIDPDGKIYTLTGNGTGAYSGDNGPANIAQINSPRELALDACDNLYIADNGNHRIRKVTFNPSCTALNVIKVAVTGYKCMYPNPVQNELIITAQKISHVTIINFLGKEVFNKEYNDITTADINTHYFPPGIYTVKVNGSHIQQFIKE